MPVEELLEAVAVTGKGQRFYRFSNADGKTWLMPARNMRTAMELYQPSGRNGKLVKSLLPRLHRFPIVRRVLKAETFSCRLSDELQALCCRSFRVSEFEFSVFCGTPCVHQKITIQLSAGNRILGYCKVCRNPEVVALFRRESGILKRLSDAGMAGIPQCLHCGLFADGTGVFIQTTEKTGQSKVVHEWTSLQDDFLERLYHATKRQVAFEKSDLYASLSELQRNAGWLPEQTDKGAVLRILEEEMSRYSGKELEMSAYHADFTPWNMFVEQGRLFVFDLEYARDSYFPFMDRYHFFTQTAFFEKHWTAAEVIRYAESEAGRWIERDVYVMYLLDVVSRFTAREKGTYDKGMLRAFAFWTALLVYFA